LGRTVWVLLGRSSFGILVFFLLMWHASNSHSLSHRYLSVHSCTLQTVLITSPLCVFLDWRDEFIHVMHAMYPMSRFLFPCPCPASFLSSWSSYRILYVWLDVSSQSRRRRRRRRRKKCHQVTARGPLRESVFSLFVCLLGDGDGTNITLDSTISIFHIQLQYLFLPQKPLYLPSHALEIKQKSVVPEQRAILAQLDVRHAPVARPPQRLGDFALLEGWEEDV
jgi:hypothetical protein